MIDEKTIDSAVCGIFGNIEFTPEPAGLYDPLRYMIGIGGKRIRPRLCLTAYSLFKDSLDEEITEPAAAMEVFHSFTLIHDDIMDRSPLRRGCETVWKKWSEDTAILSGDVMLIDAYTRIAKSPAPVRERVLSLFSRTAAEVCEGQQYDMEFEEEQEVSQEAYNNMIRLKTAVLLACSAATGAIIAGASEEACKALYDYGLQLGMAFQIADDYLDAYGDEKVFGKPIGGDILNEKKSWLTIRALEKMEDKAAFHEVFESQDLEPTVKISRVKAVYDALGVAEDAKSEIRKYSDRAIESVSGLGLSPECLDALKVFAEKLVGRVK